MSDKLEYLEVLESGSWYGERYSFTAVKELIAKISMPSEDIKGKCLYIQDNTVSQSKIRDAGFTITRSKDKADYIVITDVIKSHSYLYEIRDDIRFKNVTYLNELVDGINAGYKYIYDKDLYKYLYKYEGNMELFTSLDELMQSRDPDNVKLAMEMLSNASWEGNEIYLVELFSKYWDSGSNTMRNNGYRHSISFKGFLETVPFNYDNSRWMISSASDYSQYCKTDEHHEFVFKKYEAQFREQLDALFEEYKIKLIDINYEINKSIMN